MENEIRNWFARNYMDYNDMTIACEYCADDLDCLELLDEENSILWDVAFEYFDEDIS